MLTISQLAAYAGTTVRAVRHYHAKGLLPEPDRDHSGYRRYGAAAVTELVRIRTLAGAGVPLARVRELLVADEEAFAGAVEQIDRRLRAEIRERQRHRTRIAQLAAGDSLALPPDVVSYLERVRDLGFPERLIELERDSWILLAAQLPDQVSTLMTHKRAQIEDEELRRLYLDIAELADCAHDDARLPALADRVAAFIEAATAYGEGVEFENISPEVIALLDEAFLEALPAAPRLLELLEERGWTGWTDIRRVEPGDRPTGHERPRATHEPEPTTWLASEGHPPQLDRQGRATARD